MANKLGKVLIGTEAERPSSAEATKGVLYVATDTDTVYRNDGTQWVSVGGGGGGGGGSSDFSIPYNLEWTDLVATHPGLPDETSAARVRIYFRVPDNWDGVSNLVVETLWQATSTGLADLEDGIFRNPDSDESSQVTIQAFANNNLTWAIDGTFKTITTILLAASAVAGDWYAISFRRGTGDANTGGLQFEGASIRTTLTGVVNSNVAAFVGAKVTNSASFSHNGSPTWKTFDGWDTEIFDTDSIHDNVTNPSRLTVPTAGFYLAIGDVRWDTNTAFARALAIAVNGTRVNVVPVEDPVANVGLGHQTVALLSLVANDYVELQAYQDSGGTRTINASSEGTPSFAIYKVESGGHVIQDDNSDMTNRSKLSFQDGFVVTDDGVGDQTEIDLSFGGTAEIADVSQAVEAAGASGKVADAAHIHALSFTALTSWSPTWTSDGTAPSLGNGTLTGKYMQLGKMVFMELDLVAGSTTTFGTGQWRFDVPISNVGAVLCAIAGWAFDSSAGLVYTCSGVTPSVGISNAAEDGQVTNINPFTWASGDRYVLSGWYTIA